METWIWIKLANSNQTDTLIGMWH